jgi:hypothetical protein
MRFRLIPLLLLFVAAPLAAQEWRLFGRGALFAVYSTETGPARPRNQFFSTNWFEGHAERSFGAKSSIDFHARVTAEPATVPSDGYPQVLQYVSPRSGGPLVDRMRAHDLVEDAGVRLWWRALRLDAAIVGEPPLGAPPYRQRKSSIDFPQAPLSYDVAESFKVATRVAGAAIDTRPLLVEGAVFHAATTSGRHTTIDNGKIDSWSGRVTLRPSDAVALQLSHGKLGDAKEPVTSASATWSGKALAATALWTKRDPFTAYGAEATVRGRRNTVMARIESTDRPAGVFEPLQRRTTHFSIGYIFDIVKRIGIGAATDYHTSTHALTARYGHKPQSIYFFMRARTE